MIFDLFSHKIHSSGEEWPDKLAELAAIFGEFDGQMFDRSAFEERLQLISPRASYLAHDAASHPRSVGGRLDVSKFRDEISAYPAYLGLYFLERSPDGWLVRVSETAKRFLLQEEPDVASFLRLQLPLFQYPNAMGAAYRSFTSNLRIQSNARDRTLEFIRNGVHFSPVRLIAVALKADAALRGVSVLDSDVTFSEIFGLANHPNVNQNALPDQGIVSAALQGIRQGHIAVPSRFESRFHTLRHTEMFVCNRGSVTLREAVNEHDRALLECQLDAICSIANQFNGFDCCRNAQEIEQVIAGGGWGRYFDGVRILPSSVVSALTCDKALEISELPQPERIAQTLPPPKAVAEIYPFRERNGVPLPVRSYDRRSAIADPEATRIKLQRRNLAHKELVDKMDRLLRDLGALPKENDHIDLFAVIPNDGSFIFEMKSGGDSLLDQIRKGLSQLYEYRYRYRDMIGDNHLSLCLVLPGPPLSIPWITDYLCKDRGVNLCWFDENDQPVWPESCALNMEVLSLPPLKNFS